MSKKKKQKKTKKSQKAVLKKIRFVWTDSEKAIKSKNRHVDERPVRVKKKKNKKKKHKKKIYIYMYIHNTNELKPVKERNK